MERSQDVSRRALNGGINATKDLALCLTGAAKETVGGAINSAGALGVAAVGTVKIVLGEAIGGVKDALGAVMPKPLERS